MATMTDADILAAVKNGMGITHDFQDKTLELYIADVKAFMLDAGVKESVLSDSAAVGCILRGVIDLWNYGSGGVGFSDYFSKRVIQLASGGGSNDATE